MKIYKISKSCQIWIHEILSQNLKQNFMRNDKISTNKNLQDMIIKSHTMKFYKLWSQNITSQIYDMIKTLAQVKFSRYDPQVLLNSNLCNIFTKSLTMKIYKIYLYFVNFHQVKIFWYNCKISHNKNLRHDKISPNGN